MLVDEPRTPAIRALLDDDPAMLVWWGTEVECVSAIARLERGEAITARVVRRGIDRLEAFAADWREIDLATSVRGTALRAVRIHPLRAADAFQLAAAIEGSERNPDSLPFVTLGRRLARAAELEGFNVIEPEARAR